MRLAKRELTCPHCQAPLAKHSRHYGSVLPVALTMVLGFFVSLPQPWRWLLPLAGLGLSFYLMGREIASTHLVLREPTPPKT